MKSCYYWCWIVSMIVFQCQLLNNYSYSGCLFLSVTYKRIYLVVSSNTSFHWLRMQCILIDWCYNKVDTSYRMCSVLVLIESKFREWSINVDLISHWIAVKLSRTQTHYLLIVDFIFPCSLDICIALTKLRERDWNSKSTHTYTHTRGTLFDAYWYFIPRGYRIWYTSTNLLK